MTSIKGNKKMLEKIQKGRMAITNKELKQSQNLIKRQNLWLQKFLMAPVRSE